jgi:hypothetical protein
MPDAMVLFQCNCFIAPLFYNSEISGDGKTKIKTLNRPYDSVFPNSNPFEPHWHDSGI